MNPIHSRLRPLIFILLMAQIYLPAIGSVNPNPIKTDSISLVNQLKLAQSFYSSNLDSTEILLNDIIIQSEKNDFRSLLIKTKLELTICYEKQDNFSKSDSLLKEIKSDLLKTSSAEQTIDYCDRFAIFVNNCGYIDSAIQVLNESLNVSYENNNYRLTDIYKRLSGIYHNSGQLDSAIHFLLKAKENTFATDTIELIDLDCRIGMIYENLIYTEKSLEYYEEALKKSEAIGQNNIDVWYGMGMGNFQLGNYEKAYEYFDKVIHQCGKNWTYRYVPLNSFLHFWRCSVHLKKSNDFEVGMNFIEGTNPILTTQRKGYIGIMQAEIFMHYNLLKDAENVLLDCLEFMGNIEKSGLIMDHYSRLSQVYEKQGNFKKALYYHQLYKKAFDEERSAEVQNEIVSLQEKFKAAERETKINELTNQIEVDKLEVQLSRSRFKYSLIIVVIFFAFVIATGLFIRYRQKLNIIKLQTENKEKEHEIQKILEQSKTNILQSSLKGQEKERNRLAKELHDDLGARISALRYFVSAKNGILVGADEKVFKTELNKIQLYIRNLSHQLAKPHSTNIDLPQLIQEQKYWTDNAKIVFDFDFDSKINWSKIPEPHQNEMYRIIQESISNTFKHANADKISIKIKNVSDKIFVEVADNGSGIQKEKGAGIGLKNMAERAESIGADFSIHTAHFEGTKIVLTYSLS